MTEHRIGEEHGALPAPRVDTGAEVVRIGLGDPVQASITTAYKHLFSYLVDERGWAQDDAFVEMSAVAHTELGGPTGSGAPHPLHPFAPVGAGTLATVRGAADLSEPRRRG